MVPGTGRSGAWPRRSGGDEGAATASATGESEGAVDASIPEGTKYPFRFSTVVFTQERL
jgi:hypothetical protein